MCLKNNMNIEFGIKLYSNPQEIFDRINFLIRASKCYDVSEDRRSEIVKEIDYLITTLEGYED